VQYKRTIEPAALPVHLDDAKKQLVVEHSDDDIQIANYIRAATDYVESFTRRQLTAATHALQLGAFWSGALQLPYPPLRAVSSIQYKDSNGDTQTLAATEYDVDTAGLFGQVYAAYGKSFPSTRLHPDAITITYQAGFAAPFTADADTDVISLLGWTPVDGEAIHLAKSGGESAALPAGLAEDTTYYVRDVSGSTCKLAASSGGSAIDITDAGTGTHWFGRIPQSLRAAILLLVTHWYEHRLAVSDGELLRNIPMGVESLLATERVEP